MSQWTEFSYRYDGSYAGFLTCVFESYARRELPEQFSTAEDPRVSLWPERAVETDREKAGRVYRSLSRRISRQAQELVTQGFLTCMPDKELRLYEFLRLGYRVGPAVTRDLADPRTAAVWKAVPPHSLQLKRDLLSVLHPELKNLSVSVPALFAAVRS